MYLILHRCRYVVSSYSPLKVLEDSSVVVDDGAIVCVGECRGYNGYDRIDCKERAAVPAFGNAHVHIHTILKTLNNCDLYKASLIAVLNMAANGIAAFQSIDKDYSVVVKAAKAIGLRVRAGPIIAGDKSIQIEDVGHDLYTPIVSVENLLEIDEGLLEYHIHNLLNRNIDVNISVSRTIEEALKFKREKGVFPIEYLAKKNLLSNKIMLSHINWVSSWEVESIAYSRPRIVVCPYSDTLFGISGLPPIKPLLDRGVVIGIGTESFEHRYSSSMLSDIASIIALYRYSNTYIEIEQALDIATQGSYRAMNINAGAIDLGKEADIALFNIRKMKYYPHFKQIPPLLLYESHVDATMVKGNMVWSIDEVDRYMRILL